MGRQSIQQLGIALVVLLLGGIGTISTPVHAQVLFEIPDTTPNYQAYRHFDECIAAMNRLLIERNHADTVWRDTAGFVPQDLRQPLPEEIVTMGTQCMTKVTVDTLPLKHADFWAGALLKVNRDADVAKLYQRLLDSTPVAERFKVFSGMLRTYWNVRPVRMKAVNDTYMRAIQDLPADSVHWILSIKSTMARMYRLMGDDTTAAMFVGEIFSLWDTLPPAVRMNPEYQFVAFMGLLLLTEEQGLDSLRRSTDAYYAYYKSIVLRIFPTFVEQIPLGMQIPKIIGDFWFESVPETRNTTGTGVPYRASSPHVRPVPGTVNLIAFLQAGCHSAIISFVNGRGNSVPFCWETLAAIRRLKRLYPKLEVTVVANTYGNLGDGPPLTPAQEADTLAKYFLEFHRIPGTMVVATTPFFRFSGPDQRRIDQESEIMKRFTINGIPFARLGNVLLVDEEGKVFHNGAIFSSSDNTEQQVARKIGAVFDRIARNRK
jgi:hypothetical protein